jgi:ubiquinone/menaquinone biosynthesis C-methylase UbiE
MTTEYEAKSAYKGKTARDFDKKRFSNFIGKYIDGLEKKALSKSLKNVGDGTFVLDLACGTGRISDLLLQEGLTVVGADISVDMIKIAQSKHRNNGNMVGFVVCDAERLPFVNDSFNNVVALRLMGHIPEQIRLKILSQTKSVAKNRVILSYSNKYSIMAGVKKVRGILTGKPVPKYHLTTVNRIKKEANANGLEVASVEYVLRGIGETYIPSMKRQNLL